MGDINQSDVKLNVNNQEAKQSLDEVKKKLAESEENLLEHRTDGTDAFDTLYIGMEKKPVKIVSVNVYGTA